MPTPASITRPCPTLETAEDVARRIRCAALQITDVFAEHGVGYCRYSGAAIPTTFLFSDEAKRRPLGWQNGLLPDGVIHPTGFYGKAYRIHLIAAEAPAQARKVA